MNLLEACERFLTHCETEKNLSALTIRAYRGDLACFVACNGAMRPVEEFSESWIETAVQSWASDPAIRVATVKRRAACIKVFVRWLFRRRHIAFNPLERIALDIRLPKRLPRNLHTQEIRQLVATRPEQVSQTEPALSSRAEWDKLTARLAIEVLFLTGLRVGELVKIRMADMDQNLRQIRVWGKGSRERHVSFPDDVTIARINTYQAQALQRFGPREAATLFCNSLGRPANEQYIRRIIRAYAEGANLTRRVTPHMLRHTAATQLLEAGLDIRYVQRLLGHASITTTEVYTHVADHKLRAEIERANVRVRVEIG